MRMFTDETKVRVRYKETDMMGVVYHGNYFTWFEVARVEMLQKVGLSYVKLEEDGFKLPVLECHAEFISPARFYDELTIRVILKTPPRARIRIDYEIYCEGSLITRGYTLHGFINNEGKPIRPPHKFNDTINTLIGSTEN